MVEDVVLDCFQNYISFDTFVILLSILNHILQANIPKNQIKQKIGCSPYRQRLEIIFLEIFHNKISRNYII